MIISYLQKRGGGKLVVASLFSLIVGLHPILAQTTTDVNRGFVTSTMGMVRYIPVMQKLAYVLAAIIAVVSAVIIYKKLHDGDENAKKLIVLPALSCVFLTCSATALPKFFGLDGESQYVMTSDFAHSMGIYLPGEGGHETAPDGSDRFFGVADDFTKIYAAWEIKNLGWNDNHAPDGMAKAPNGRYEYYINTSNGKLWYDFTQAYSAPYGRGIDKVGKAPDGSWRWYAVADDGTKVWGYRVGEYYWEGGNSGLRKESATSDRCYFVADDGTKVYTNNYPQSGSDYGIGWNGTAWTTYTLADDGSKIWKQNIENAAFNNPKSPNYNYGINPGFVNVLKGNKMEDRYGDGVYWTYMIRDDGVKVYGAPIKNRPTADQF